MNQELASIDGATVVDFDNPHMVTRNGRLHCIHCRTGSEALYVSRSFHDPGRLDQYREFAARHKQCVPPAN